jgi:hypothetical protein
MIEERYKELCEKKSDINLHLPTIRKYVTKGDVVIELGVRDCVSTWALLANKPRALASVDVVRPPEKNLKEVQLAAKKIGTDFRFELADSLNLEIQGVDVLFIDTTHTYSQLIKELWAHARNVKKYIILHDIEIPEMKACVTDFLYNTDWKVEEELKTHTGLMVLKRV